MRKKIACILLMLVLGVALLGCAGQSQAPQQKPNPSDAAVEMTDLTMSINGTVVPVNWEDNAAVAALRQQASQKPLVVETSLYGGFEQVGSLGGSYPAEDVQTTTKCGDVCLYAGSNIVIFFGPNTWAYTRLGKIDLPDDAVKELLDRKTATVQLSL